MSVKSKSITQNVLDSMTLYQKLAAVRSNTEAITKNKKGYNYKYVSLVDILAKVTAGMKLYHVSLHPSITPSVADYSVWHYEKLKFSRDGSQQYNEPVDEVVASGEIVYRWVNDDKPEEYLDVPWYFVGSQADPSQALGSALSYSMRQFLLNFFQIASLDDEDPDAYRRKQQEALDAEDRIIAEGIVEQIHEYVTGYLQTHEGDKPKVTALVKKYAKEGGKPSANYYNIKSSEVANKLFQDLKGQFAYESKED